MFDKTKAANGYVGFNWYSIEVWESPPPHEPKNLGPCTCTLSLNGSPVVVGEATFSKGSYQDQSTLTYDTTFDVRARYFGGWTFAKVLRFRGKGTYDLFANSDGSQSSIVDTTAGYPNFKYYGPYDGVNTMTITEWSDWQVAGSFILTHDNTTSGEKRWAVGSFSCGR
ncbi:MAG: hypothetical protein H7X80_03500 [bacterium]|nr:hypothetical protein [Candidatus Kapabacteria bacterium]